MARKYDVEDLKSIKGSSIKELIERIDSSDQYFKENFCKEFRVFFYDYPSEEKVKKMERQIIESVLKSTKALEDFLIIRSFEESKLKIDFKEKVSLRFIIDVTNVIKSVEELKCESIEYHNEEIYQYESLILEVRFKK